MTSSARENHPQRHRSSILAAAETRRIFSAGFPDFPAENWRAFVMPSKRIASAQNCAYHAREAKIVQDAETGWRRWAPLVWRGFAVSRVGRRALFDADDPLPTLRRPS